MTDFNIEHALIQHFQSNSSVDEAYIEALSEKLQFLLGQYTDEEVDGESVKTELETLVTEMAKHMLDDEGAEGSEVS